MQLCARFSVRSCHSLRLAVPVRSFGTTSPRVWAWKSAAVFGCFPLKSPLAAGITYTSRARSMGTDLRASLARKPCAVAPPPAPNGGKFKVAVCQLSVTANKEQNINHAREVIEGAADEGAELIVLPEMWNCPYSNSSFPVYAEDIDAGGNESPSTMMLSDVARKKQVTIIGGSIPERSYDHLYNTCCIYGRNGELQAKHRKVHLFDIDIPGKIVFKESETLTAGEGLTVVDTYVGRIGVGICYDIRFEELAMLYAARGAQMICYPGAFNMTTGPLHWELLQRARAIDNQLYVITCSPARDPTASYVAWGHSTVVGPQFGEIISKTGHEEATIFADIDYSVSDQRRLNMPLDKQRRGDLYQLVDVSRCHEGSE
ncbi:hypothetical protein O6H91_15G008800 [Diphasiastrum complanatum]|uniref:Uncharacterized protein n=1 Tax=Diphasiastrum complanatum TaxID=34168 RepID=A0ACC2BFR3_DIPCM|nr:hypothetical protein O6H91_15G008800 [Diphasiastrum complanatum]